MNLYESLKSNLKESKEIIDENMTIEELDDLAYWVYKYTNRESEWEKFTDKEIKALWELCKLTKENPFGRAYDDEVYDEMDRRGFLNESELKEKIRGHKNPHKMNESEIDHFIERGNIFIPVRVGETDEEVLKHLEALGNLKDVTPTQEQIDSGEYISELVHPNNDSKNNPLSWPEWRKNPDYEIKEAENKNEYAKSIIQKFNDDKEKTFDKYQKVLNEISKMEWDNEISRNDYEDYIKELQQIYAARNK